MLSELIFNNDNISSDKTIKILRNYPIQISFTIPDVQTKIEYKLKGTLKLSVFNSKFESVFIQFIVKVLYLPQKIYIKSNNGKLYWKENRLILNKEYYKEYKIFNIGNLILKIFKRMINF